MTLSEFSPVFWSMIIGYCIILALTSFSFGKFVKNTDDYFGSSRTTPWWSAGLSFFMTAFSASVFIGQASFTYRYGGLSLLNVLWSPGILAGYFIFARLWHRTGCKTVIEFMIKRFSAPTANFFLMTGVPIRLLDNANRIYVTSVIIEVMLGTSLLTAIGITTFLAVLYTIFGGYLSVVATDVLQAVILAVITLAISVVALVRVGGVSGLMTKLPEGYFSLMPADGNYNYWFIIALGVAGLFSWNGYWSLVQRYVSVRTEKDATKVALVGGISYYALFPLFAIPPITAVILAPGLEGAVQTEQAYLLVAQQVLPIGILGIMFFALFGATVTALNSELNVMSQIFVEDILRKRAPKLVERYGLHISRLAIITIAVLCMVVSAFIREMGGSFQFLTTLMSMTIIPTFLPLLYGLLFRKTPGWGACTAFLVGLTTSCILNFGFDYKLQYIVLGNFIATLVTLLITDRFGKPTAVQIAVISHEPDWQAKEEDRVQPDRKGPGIHRPMCNIIGVSLLAVSLFTLISLFEPQGGTVTIYCISAALGLAALAMFALGNLKLFKNQ